MRQFTFLLLLFLLNVSNLWAHPHMFIDTRLAISLEENNLKGIGITWWFDPMFTASIQADFDEDKNGSFDAREVGLIQEYAFSNLKNYDYFTFVTEGGSTLVPETIETFTARLDQGTLVYEFYTSFSRPISGKTFAVAIYDDTFWCDITYTDKNPVQLIGNNNAEWELVENRNMAITYDNSIAIDRNGKNYSGTAYPQQIVVHIP